MTKVILKTTLSLVLFLGLQVNAASIGDRVLQSGAHAGQKLMKVVEAYTIPGQSGGSRIHIPSKAIRDAFDFYDRYEGTNRYYSHEGIIAAEGKPGFEALGGVQSTTGPTIGNQNYIVIFDLNLHSSLKRLHVIDLRSGDIDSFEAAHGSESDCGSRKPGYACSFISDRDSKASPLGFFATGRSYNSVAHGEAVTMIGLEKSNSGFSGNDVPTTIVIHKANYVKEGYAGRSSGCPAVSHANIGWIVNNLANGVLFYFYHESLDQMRQEPRVGGLLTLVTPEAAGGSSDGESGASTTNADDDN